MALGLPEGLLHISVRDELHACLGADQRKYKRRTGSEGAKLGTNGGVSAGAQAVHEPCVRQGLFVRLVQQERVLLARNLPLLVRDVARLVYVHECSKTDIDLERLLDQAV